MVEISTSILSVKKENIINTIYNLEKAKTDYIHIDVMDGKFVKNNTNNQMIEYCEYLCNITNLHLDIHLMVEDIKNYIDSFSIFYPYVITFHYEACKNDEEILETIEYIKSKNIKVGIAIKPDTPVSKIYKFLNKINMVLIMTVEPGKGGQELLTKTIKKINEIKEYINLKELDTFIEADGGINVENIQELKEKGLDIAVAGNSIISSNNYAETIKKLKN